MKNIELRCSKCGRFFCEINSDVDSDFLLKILCQRSKCKTVNLFPISSNISNDVKIYERQMKKVKPVEMRCRICDRFLFVLFINNDMSSFSLSVKCQRSSCKAMNLVSFGPKQDVEKVKTCECLEKKAI